MSEAIIMPEPEPEPERQCLFTVGPSISEAIASINQRHNWSWDSTPVTCDACGLTQGLPATYHEYGKIIATLCFSCQTRATVWAAKQALKEEAK